MAFKKGQILEFNFLLNMDSKVIGDRHKVIVLYSRDTPYRTETIAPITSLTSLASQNKVKKRRL